MLIRDSRIAGPPAAGITFTDVLEGRCYERPPAAVIESPHKANGQICRACEAIFAVIKSLGFR